MSLPAESPFTSPPRAARWALGITAAALIAGWWRLVPAGDDALLASVFLAGATWWLLRPTPAGPAERPAIFGVGLAFVAAAGLVVSRGVTLTDFWFLRLGGPLIFLFAALALCGWRGVRAGWPGWVALVLWHFWPPWTNSISEPVAMELNRLTARAGSALLWYTGHESHVEGPFIWLPHGRVEVMRPCTAIPLVGSLVHTLFPAAIALRLTWRRTALMLALVVPLAFLVSAVRCAWLALVSGDPERFAYWHGDMGGGIFTAVALVLLGLIALGGARLPGETNPPTTPASPALPAAPVATWDRSVAATLLVAGAIVAIGFPQAPVVSDHVPLVWDAPAAWKVREVRTQKFSAEQRTGQRPIATLTEWSVETPAGRARVWMGYGPNFVGTDAHQLVFFQGLDSADSLAGQLATSGAAEHPVWRTRAAQGHWWATTLVADGSFHATAASWLQDLRAQWWDATRWWTLALAKGPLRDKRIVWVGVCWPPQAGWNDPAVDGIVAEILASSQEMARRALN